MKAIRKYGITVAQQKAITSEVNRQIIEADIAFAKSLDVLILYALMVEFGFGKKRLKRFYDAFNSANAELRKSYEMQTTAENVKLARIMLKRKGIDIEEWYKADGLNI